MDVPGPRRHDVVTASVAEAEAYAAHVYFPHRLTFLGDHQRFEMRMRAVEFGPVSVGRLAFSDEIDIRTTDQVTSYEVNVPLHGPLAARIGRESVVAEPTRAVMFRPYEVHSMHGLRHGGGLLGVKIERTALERRLAVLADCEVTTPLPTATLVDLTSPWGRDWWSIARTLADLVDGWSALVTRPEVTTPLVDSVLTGLLYAADHPLRERLLSPAPAAARGTVRRAVELLESSPAEPWTVTELAERAGGAVRSLQSGFRREVGMPPLAYLRQVRLRRVHRDLVAADARDTTVAEVAVRWGITHLGRFAREYAEQYGCPPSLTLRA